MEAVQQIFFILGAWKCDFAEFRNPRFRGHLAFFKSFFSILEARKFDFCRVFTTRKKTQGSRLPSIVWANFTHFGILKMWFLTILETNISRYLAMSGKFSYFRGLKVRFPCRDIHVARIPSFMLSNFPHVPSIVWKIFPILAAYSWNQRFKVPRKE